MEYVQHYVLLATTYAMDAHSMLHNTVFPKVAEVVLHWWLFLVAFNGIYVEEALQLSKNVLKEHQQEWLSERVYQFNISVVLSILEIWLAFSIVRAISRFMGRITHHSYRSKHVLITGGADEFLRKGANVTILSRTPQKLRLALEHFRKEGLRRHQKVFCVACNVADPLSVQRAVKAATERHQCGVDVLVCSAGYGIARMMLDPHNINDFARHMEVNYLGQVYPTRIVLPNMIANHSGQIVLIGGTAALCSLPGYAAMSSAKHAVDAFAASVRLELNAHRGVSMHVIHPPLMDTNGLRHQSFAGVLQTTYSMAEGLHLHEPIQVAKKAIFQLARGDAVITFTRLQHMWTRITLQPLRGCHLLEPLWLILAYWQKVYKLWRMQKASKYHGFTGTRGKGFLNARRRAAEPEKKPADEEGGEQGGEEAQ